MADAEMDDNEMWLRFFVALERVTGGLIPLTVLRNPQRLLITQQADSCELKTYFVPHLF